MRTDGWSFFSSDDRRPVQINVRPHPSDPTAPGLVRRLMDVLLHRPSPWWSASGWPSCCTTWTTASRTRGTRADAGLARAGAFRPDGGGQAGAGRRAVPALAGLCRMARGWRKPATTLAVLLATCKP